MSIATTYRTCPRSGLQFEANAEKLIIANAVAALHYLGYGAKMVAGARARDPAIHGAYCGEGEELVGWISAGTPDGPPKGRGEIDPGAILRGF